MAWSTPRTWVAGEIVTASLMNTYVRDQFLALFPTALNAAPEDIPFNSVNFQGVSGMTWTVTSGDVEWQWLYNVGRRALVSVGVNTSTIGGTLSRAVRVGFPGVSFLNVGVTSRCGRAIDNGTPISALCAMVSGSNQAEVSTWGANWNNSTNNTAIQFTLESH